MNEKINDPKTFMLKYNIFDTLQKEIDVMENEIKSKNIEIKTIRDIERVQTIYTKHFKELIKLIDSSKEFEKDELQVLKNGLILDFHIRLAESVKCDVLDLLNVFGRYHTEQFKKAAGNPPFT